MAFVNGRAQQVAAVYCWCRCHGAPPDQFPKRCSCGLELVRRHWLRLDYVGVMGDAEELLELRNCLCGTTLSVVISRGGGR